MSNYAEILMNKLKKSLIEMNNIFKR